MTDDPITADCSVADQCRRMGLAVGDAIEGEEAGLGWRTTVRLKLLWLGETCAAWSQIGRFEPDGEWSAPIESTAWNLAFRKWRKVNAVENTCDAPRCNQPATCAIPDPGGYRRTCWRHYQELA